MRIVTVVATAVVLVVPVSAHAQERNVQLTWVDRSGTVIETVGAFAAYRSPELSADGTQLAVHRHRGLGGDILIGDGHGRLTSLVTEKTGTEDNASPIWAPDGRSLVYASLRNAKWGLYRTRVDGSGEERLIESGSRKMPMAWSPDGRFIVYWVNGGTQWVLPLTGDRTPFRLRDGNCGQPQFSPDGKWIAYTSNDSGRAEIYLRPFPSGDERKVSVKGGTFMRWRGDSKELYFLSQASRGQMMAADIRPNGAAVDIGAPHALFDSGYVNLSHPGGNYHTYTVSPDGQRFLIPRPQADTLTQFDHAGKVVRTLPSESYSWPMPSPDGTRVAVYKDFRHVQVLDFDSGKVTSIFSGQQEDSLQGVVWSPDGKQLVYAVQTTEHETFYRVAASGSGEKELIYRLPGAFNALSDWSMDGRYLLYHSAQLGGSILFLLPIDGNRTPIEVARSDKNMIGAMLSPDCRFVLYRVSEFGKNELWVRPIDASGRSQPPPVKVPAEAPLGMLSWKPDGNELYYFERDRGVMSVEFHGAPTISFGTPRRLFTAPDTIPPTLNADSLGGVGRDGRVVLAVPAPLYRTLPPLAQLTLFDRQGKAVQKIGEPGRFNRPAMSPDGRRIATMVNTNDETGQTDIWTFDVATGKRFAVTDDGPFDANPMWTPDGTHVLYVSQRPGGFAGIYRKAWDGSGSEELLFRNVQGAPVFLNDISSDGKFLAFESGSVVYTLSLAGTDPARRQPVEFVREEFFAGSARFSADSRYLAYGSDETKKWELYVRSMDPATGAPVGDRKWQVSKAGSNDMTFWRGDGREILYLENAPDLTVMTTAIVTAPSFQAQTPSVLFHIPGDVQGDLSQSRNITRDGQRFVFVTNVPVGWTAK